MWNVHLPCCRLIGPGRLWRSNLSPTCLSQGWCTVLTMHNSLQFRPGHTQSPKWFRGAMSLEFNGGGKSNLSCREKLQTGVIRPNYALAGETCTIDAPLSIHLRLISFPLSFTLSGNAIFFYPISRLEIFLFFFPAGFMLSHTHTPWGMHFIFF